MKRLLYFPVIIALIVLVVSVVIDFSDRPPVKEVLTVGVVMPEDGDAYQVSINLNKAGVKDANCRIRENVAVSDAEAVMEELVSQGCYVIFCMSPDFEEAMLAAAANAPDVEFFCYQGYLAPASSLTNVHDMGFTTWAPAFAAGTLAAFTTENGVLAHVMPTRSYDEVAMANSYYLGAIAVRDVTLYVLSTEDTSPESISDKLPLLADTHADVLSYSLDHEELPLYSELQNASYISFTGNGESLMSWTWDLEALFASALYPYLTEREIPASIYLGMEACNVTLSKEIPDANRKSVESVLKDIEEGNITPEQIIDSFIAGGIIDLTE